VPLGPEPEREKAEIGTLIESKVDGLIIASEQPEGSPASFTELRKRKIPFVLIDRFFPNCPFPSVRVNDEEVGRVGTQCLIDLGHTRIGFIHGQKLSPGSLRYAGYRKALRAARIPFLKELVANGNFDIPSGREAMKKLLELENRPTAVFAANDPMGIGAVYACRDAGLTCRATSPSQGPEISKARTIRIRFSPRWIGPARSSAARPRPCCWSRCPGPTLPAVRRRFILRRC
jgi:Transcriptional regulators